MTRPPISWSWQVSLGNVLTAIPMVVGLVWFGADLRNDIESHAIRLDGVEAVTKPLPEAAAETRSTLADHNRRIDALETTAARNVERLNAGDVTRTAVEARLGRLDELMTEVREALRIFNARQGSQP